MVSAGHGGRGWRSLRIFHGILGALLITGTIAGVDLWVRAGELSRWGTRDWLAWIVSLALSLLIWRGLIARWRGERGRG